MITQNNEYIGILENHYYGKNGHKMSAKTRNTCSNADIEILEEISKILFPDEKFEILVKPSKKGCYQDTLAIIGAMTGTAALLITFLSYLSQRAVNKSQIETNESQKKVNESQEQLNQLLIKELEQKLKNNNIENLKEKAEKIFTSRKIKKSKNDRFECLRDDSNVEKDEIIAKINTKVVAEKTITDAEFDYYIDPLPETTDIYSEEKIHSLLVISDVKNKKYKKWIWKFEDEKTKKRVNLYMKDKKFYDLYLQKIFGLRKIVARVKYDIEEYENGEKDIKNQDIIFVYTYNNIERAPLPKDEKISFAPLIIENLKKEKEEVKNTEEQGSLF